MADQDMSQKRGPGAHGPRVHPSPNDGTLLKGKEEEYLICAREERAKPIGDRRAGRWSPCGAGAEAGRGRRPRGFSVGPERETSEPEA